MGKVEWQLRWAEAMCRAGKKVVLLGSGSKTEFKLNPDGSVSSVTTPVKSNGLEVSGAWHDEMSWVKRVFTERAGGTC